ncbi:phosphatidylglycerol lysyltransferase [Paenibacillus endophyticus]|uniref:Phosphatidylglycerol lysyltransferase n=1 Tax=Paenibacillus endophyticus TaxID=1294268 RepID=A0A7W5C882_9BACL|nr:phosphatidylglycerol lysyltransferase domain-containing protein [Paenibacillus endophyticus]MBB3152812.1 phosphatidylglycerol lysyltransferase [Paenibacillus endophyticus]
MIDNLSEKRLKDLLKTCGHQSHSHLYYHCDKEWLWDSQYEALLVYRSIGNRRIVLGDPIGKPAAVERLIMQFIEECSQNKRVPVFYQTNATYLSLYKRLGMLSSKIGEEAQVDLAGFSLKGKQWLKLRNRMNKSQRSGFAFEVMQPPYSASLLNRLEAISDEWLANRKEKGFSVGSFSRAYVNQFPIAVLIGPSGQYEAFVSIAGGHSQSPRKKEDSLLGRITIDLMRYTKACPHGTMDVLFASLFLWAQEQGYPMCSLGMAPLANSNLFPAAGLLYRYGNKMYNFKGLYEYKNKFAPMWKDVYFVYPPGTLPLNLALLSLIIHRPKAQKHMQQHIAISQVSEKVSTIKKRA